MDSNWGTCPARVLDSIWEDVWDKIKTPARVLCMREIDSEKNNETRAKDIAKATYRESNLCKTKTSWLRHLLT